MKRFARNLVVSVLGWQVRRLQRKYNFTTIGVVGGIGKTSTKFAIARVLGSHKRVRFQQGNYNDLVSVPLVFFGRPLPSLLNPFAWLATFIACEKQLHAKPDYDVVVLELGTDGPGQIAAFKRYVKLDIAVVTAVVPEHMEFFADLDDVAKEELSVVQYAEHMVINADLVAPEYREFVPEAETYALHAPADYQMDSFSFDADGVSFQISHDGKVLVEARHDSMADAHLYSLTAATAVAHILGFTAQQMLDGFAQVKPVSGRLQRLAGVNNSVIIDDTYNSSPEAAKAALEILYRIKAPQKIALLGNMNELGAYSKEAHTELGKFCDPNQLDEVLTLGPDANTYLAPAATKAGCKVKTFTSPYDAGEHLKNSIKNGAVVLIKGSQNRVFAEEAVKAILANPADESKLVRQSPSWLKLKQKQFHS